MKDYIKKYLKTHWIYYLFVLPFLVLFTVFVIIPVGMAIFYSFTYYNVLEPAEYIGAGNYVRLFTEDSIFLTALKNTLLIALVTGPTSYLMCFFLAWMLNDLGPRLRSVLTLAFYTPTMATSVYVVWTYIFSGDRYGFINGLLLRLNIINQPIVFLKNPDYMMAVIITVTLWMSLGTSFLAFIAGFQGLDRTLFEAGAVEGIKNRWQELCYITLPSMRPQLMFGAVMQISAAFSVGAVGDALVGFPSVDYATHTVINHLTDYGTVRFELGYACAIATLLFFMTVGTNKLVNLLLSKVGR